MYFIRQMKIILLLAPILFNSFFIYAHEPAKVELYSLEKPTLPNQKNLTDFEKKYNFNLNGVNSDFFYFLLNYLPSTPITDEQKKVIHSLENLFRELSNSNYDKSSVNYYINWALTLSSTLFFKKDFSAEKVLNDFFSDIVQLSSQTMIPRPQHERGRHPAFELRNSKKETIALLKVVKEPRNAWASVSPIMKQEGLATVYEKAGYDLDIITGLKMTPPTLLGKVKIGSKTKDAVIQKFIPNCATLSELLHREDGAELLKSLPISAAQTVALNGLIKGRLGGHLDNYLFHIQEDDKGAVIDKVYEIDLEELLPPCNKLEKGMILYPLKEDKEKNERITASDMSSDLEEMSYQTVCLCRMCILGLPQNGKPFERACLMIISHDLLPSFLEVYHDELREKNEIREPCLQAQMERLKKIQKICKEQLELSEISLTPRDLYFHLFGGKHLYEIARKKDYPNIVIFNQVIGDQLQHCVKDFSSPNEISPCSLLKKPKKDDKGAYFFNNLILLERDEKNSRL